MSSETSVRRDVAVILIGGAVLGLLYNGVGLATRPPRGIPWVAAKEVLPTLESMSGRDSAGAAHGERPPTPQGGSGVSLAASLPTSDTGVTRAVRGRGGNPATTPLPAGTTGSPSHSSGPATPGSSPPAAAALPDPRPAAPLPFIPESGQPIQVQLPMVKRFFDARAALFLDARDPAEYEKGHLPGAIRLTSSEAQNEPERMKALPVEGRPTIVYCEGGTCEASLDLARFLIESGFKKVLVYMGGFPEWEAAGHPVERGSGR